MTDPPSPRWRRARSTVFALVAALLAAAGHAVAGGGFPDAAALLSTTALVGGSVSGLVGRRRSAGGIFGVLLASQVPFHLAFIVAGHQHHSVNLVRMAAFHLVAAGLAALVLARGEAALFVLVSWWERLLPGVPAAPRIAPEMGTTRLAGAAIRVPSMEIRLRPISRRGPPALG